MMRLANNATNNYQNPKQTMRPYETLCALTYIFTKVNLAQEAQEDSIPVQFFCLIWYCLLLASSCRSPLTFGLSTLHKISWPRAGEPPVSQPSLIHCASVDWQPALVH
jgi:hypothetical protein